jgi:hypothetical protein
MPGLEDDLRAAVHADRELGRDYEADVVRALAERLDAEIDRRVQERLDAQLVRHQRSGAGFDFLGVLLALGSIGIAVGVPSAMHGHVGAAGTFVLTLVAWAAIAAINFAWFLGRRRG